jgi:hypothetical protein
MLAAARKIFWKVRDALVEMGVVSRPRFYMRRCTVGENRERLAHRGSSRRIRRTSLKRLLTY